MGKKKQGEKYMVSRAVYKAVKKYDHQQFEEFCTRIYTSGWEDGRSAADRVDLDEIEKVIREVKGIGEAKAGKIMEAINGRIKKDTESERA